VEVIGESLELAKMRRLGMYEGILPIPKQNYKELYRVSKAGMRGAFLGAIPLGLLALKSQIGSYK